ncbi:DUF6970 domain-containing protein [Hymenobacter sp.]|uniref:DUF6970 domain-containing protein n=1 Tax=Hymenobacter sp. TaxID=1898978 RepID=UPI00286BD795|nr:hypothetical protein [Hymenobacter sp.]
MRLLRPAAFLFLATACAPQQVSVTTPTTPPETGQVSPGTPAPTSANTVDPVPSRVAESDTTARPQWLKARIAAVLAERKRNPLIRILRYDYGGQTVYYQSAPCCDQYSQVFDTKGRVVCSPDGGITGKGDGKCPDFEKNKTNEKLVWQDPR